MQFVFNCGDLLQHHLDCRLQLRSLTLLLLVKLRLECDFLAFQVGNVAVQLRVNFVNFIEVLLDLVKFIVQGLQGVSVLVLLRLCLLQLQILAL